MSKTENSCIKFQQYFYLYLLYLIIAIITAFVSNHIYLNESLIELILINVLNNFE